MVNYQVTVLLDRLLSNGLAILCAVYYYIHMVCVQVAITQRRLYICTGKSKFLLFIFSMSGNFSGSSVFRFSVYNAVYCNTAHPKLKDSTVTMLKWAFIEPPLHSNEWVQLFLRGQLLIFISFLENCFCQGPVDPDEMPA